MFIVLQMRDLYSDCISHESFLKYNQFGFHHIIKIYKSRNMVMSRNMWWFRFTLFVIAIGIMVTGVYYIQVDESDMAGGKTGIAVLSGGGAILLGVIIWWSVEYLDNIGKIHSSNTKQQKNS